MKIAESNKTADDLCTSEPFRTSPMPSLMSGAVSQK